jgi:hypothetical protein
MTSGNNKMRYEIWNRYFKFERQGRVLLVQRAPAGSGPDQGWRSAEALAMACGASHREPSSPARAAPS